MFYTAVFDVRKIPMAGTGDGYFWADELFVSTADNEAAQGELTGRHHLAFQAHRATTPLSCWIPTATTSRPCTTARPGAARLR